MNIHAHIITWNEDKILRYTLDHYSKFCEKIFIYDNMSTDNTDNICSNYSKVSVEKWSTPDNKYNDIVLADMKSNIYKKSRKENVDWVVVCDCDEYLYHEDLLNKLKEYKENFITMPLIDGHDMFSEYFPQYDGGLITDKIKNGSETCDSLCKNIIFDPSLDVVYFPGAHKNMCENAIKSKQAELKLLHYKYLGKQESLLRQKELAERLSDFNKKAGFSKHWTKSPVDYMDFILQKNYKVI